jgi:ubiquinone/menaquinone biosynthesis C-methylase UbiE
VGLTNIVKMKTEEKEAKSKYDIIAEHYHNWRTKLNPKGWIYNEHLEMPATLKLLGNVKGKKILDFGCGTGIYTKILKKKGAKVKGFDISPEMLRIAKDYVKGVELKQGTGNKIPFNKKFDIVVASLVFDYFDDWNRPLKEINRVLKKEGYFVFSTGNPVTESSEKFIVNGKRMKHRGIGASVVWNYFKERKIWGTWKNILHKKKVRNVKMPTYHKTYETMIKSIVKNGFEIVDYADCFPLKKSKKLFPEEYKFLSNVPYFCVWKVRKK